MFILGFFSGILFVVGSLWGFMLLGRKRQALKERDARLKEEIFMKALPVYEQARRIFKQDDIEPQKIASLMFVASLVEKSLEDELSKSTPINKVQ